MASKSLSSADTTRSACQRASKERSATRGTSTGSVGMAGQGADGSARRDIATRERERLEGEILRVLCAHGPSEPHPEPRRLAKLRGNCRQRLNRVAGTLVDLLQPTGEARARLLAIGDLIDPPTADVPLRVLNAQETAIEGALNTVQLAYQGGAQDYATLSEIEDDCAVNLVLYRQMLDAAAAEKAALIRRSA